MKKVLSEEEYIKQLSAILKRDFYPALLEEVNRDEALQMSLSEFQSRFTTEDDVSFEELLERENERKRSKFERIFGAPAAVCDNPDKRLLLKANEVDEWKFKRNPKKTLMIEAAGASLEDPRKPSINIKSTRFPSFTEKGKVYRIPPTPSREQLANSLTTKASVSKPKNQSSSSSTKYSLEDLKALTPKRNPK